MSNKDDKDDKDEQDWIDLLAGQSVPNADPKIVREAQILRGAWLAHTQRLKNDSEIPFPKVWENILKEIPPPPIPFWKKIFQPLKQFITPPWFPKMVWAMPATAFVVLVMSVITYIVWPHNPLDTTYQTIYARQTDEMVDKLRHFTFRWEGEDDNVFTFSPTEQPSSATKAFGAGLLMGREALLGKNEIALPTLLLPSTPAETWLKTQWADDFELGYWAILLWTATQFPDDLPPAFWDEQWWIFSQLKAAFVARAETDNEAKKVLSQLENQIEPQLKKLLTAAHVKTYKDLGFHLKKMIYFLAPGD